MKNQNVERIQEMYKSFSKGDIASVLSSFADNGEITCYGSTQIPWAGQWKGKEKIQQFFQSLGTNLEFLEFTPKEYVADENVVVAFGLERDRVRSTGKEIATEWAMRWELLNGKAVSCRIYEDSNAAFLALGR
jgi:uncharacterized protein